jgi:hypothetical protein
MYQKLAFGSANGDVITASLEKKHLSQAEFDHLMTRPDKQNISVLRDLFARNGNNFNGRFSGC